MSEEFIFKKTETIMEKSFILQNKLQVRGFPPRPPERHNELNKMKKKNFRKLCRIYKNQEGSGPGRSLPVTQSLCVRWSNYFLAYVIFMAHVAVILKPCSASLATPACVSLSNSTKAMSCFPGTSRTSLNPGNLPGTRTLLTHWFWFLRRPGPEQSRTLNSLVEQHGEHHLVGLFWQVVEEQDVVGRVVRHLRGKHFLLIC